MTCSVCGNENDLRYVVVQRNGESSVEDVCAPCLMEMPACYECGQFIADRDDIVDHHGHNMCRDCASRIRRCDNCDAELMDYNLSAHNDLRLCPSCYQSAIIEDTAIKPWDWRPTFVKHGKGTAFGLEIEMEIPEDYYRDEVAETTIRQFPTFFKVDKNYFQHDGSLEHGLELVTMPASFDYIKNSGMKNVIDYMRREYDAVSHNTTTCGLHVHIDRSGITPDHAARIAYLVHRLQSVFGILSRRERSTYARYKTPEFSTYNDDKYEAVNFYHQESIEFRMFKGTLKWNTILATIDIVRLTVDFAKDKDYKYYADRDTSDVRKDFLAFLEANGGEELQTYLAERGL